MPATIVGRGAPRRGSGAEADGARRRAVFVLASTVLIPAACAQAPGRLERATAPAHATGDVPIAGPVVGGGAEAHGSHDGHAQGRAATRPRTR